MQRIQKTVRAGLVLGLLLSLTAAAEAQVFYVQSSNFQAAPVSRSVVVSRSIGVRRYCNSYGSSSSYGLGNSYGYAQAWNNRRSAPPVYVENHYLPESSEDFYTPTISSQSFGVYQPIVASRVLSSQPQVIYSEPVVYSDPVVYSEPVVVSQPVRVYRSTVSSPRVTREEIKSRPNHFEYEQKGKIEAFDGRRVKTYRYEYEVDQRPGRTKVTIDFDD